MPIGRAQSRLLSTRSGRRSAPVSLSAIVSSHPPPHPSLSCRRPRPAARAHVLPLLHITFALSTTFARANPLAPPTLAHALPCPTCPRPRPPSPPPPSPPSPSARLNRCRREGADSGESQQPPEWWQRLLEQRQLHQVILVRQGLLFRACLPRAQPGGSCALLQRSACVARLLTGLLGPQLRAQLYACVGRAQRWRLLLVPRIRRGL